MQAEIPDHRCVMPVQSRRGSDCGHGSSRAGQVRDEKTNLREPLPAEAVRLARTITVAITSGGTDGGPRPEGKRSSNISSGKKRPRCSARKACTESLPSRWPQILAASRSWRSGREEPCISRFLQTSAEIASFVQIKSARSQRKGHFVALSLGVFAFGPTWRSDLSVGQVIRRRYGCAIREEAARLSATAWALMAGITHTKSLRKASRQTYP